MPGPIIRERVARASRPCGRSLAAFFAALALAALPGCRGSEGGAGTASPTGSAAAAVASEHGPENLLLVTLDTVRADHLGAYGYPGAETPVLDRLAREGVRFAAASSPVPLTLPAHSSLLSGLLPPHHGLRNNGAGSFPADRETLATRLSAAGYRTGAFVGSFVLDHRFGLARGFATYDDEMERDASGGRALDAERRGDRVVDRALAWLQGSGSAAGSEKRGSEKRPPFFLWVHLYDAHAPYTPPAPYGDRHPGKPYDGEIAFADAQVGRLLAALDQLHLTESTVVAVAADHGEALGEHGELTHGLLLYEPTLHVPLLVKAPGLSPRVVSTPVSLVDLAPTLSGLLRQSLGVSGGGLDGRDLSAALSRGEEPPQADLYAETRYPAIFGWSPLAALRRRDQKFIEAPKPELYDLAKDPAEGENLAAQPERVSETRGFAERLAALDASAASSGSAGPAPKTAAPSPGSADREARARLESLGYAGGRAAAAAAAQVRPGSGADPKDRVALFRRYEEANTQIRAGRPAEALPILAEIVAADPGNPVFRGKLAQSYRERGELGKAIPLYRQATVSAPGDSEAWYNLGVTLTEAGQAAEAAEALAKAVSLDPGRAEQHNALGIALLGTRKVAEAAREFEQAVALDPGDARAHNNLGNLFRSAGRLDDAEAAYRQATAIAPRYAEAWNGLGTLLVDKNRPQEALACFDRALTLSPRYHEVRLNRAIAYEMAGETQAAMAAYRDFLTAAGRDPQYASQRRAAEQLLARLSGREAGSTSTERR